MSEFASRGWGQPQPGEDSQQPVGWGQSQPGSRPSDFWGTQPGPVPQPYPAGQATPPQPASAQQPFWGGNSVAQQEQGEQPPSNDFWGTQPGPVPQPYPAGQATPPQPASAQQPFWDTPTSPGGPQPGGSAQLAWELSVPSPNLTASDTKTSTVSAQGPLIATRKDRIMHTLSAPKVWPLVLVATVVVLALLVVAIRTLGGSGEEGAPQSSQYETVVPVAPSGELVAAQRGLRQAISEGSAVTRLVPSMQTGAVADLRAAVSLGESLVNSRNIAKVESATRGITELLPLAHQEIEDAHRPAPQPEEPSEGEGENEGDEGGGDTGVEVIDKGNRPPIEEVSGSH